MLNLYIAGPMTGLPQFNFPAFFELGDTLRSLGYAVTSPAELEDEEVTGVVLSSETGRLGTGTNGKTWGDFLMRDVKLIADKVDGVCVLPDWVTSRGARLEVFIAMNVQKPVYKLVGDTLEEICVACLADLVMDHTVLNENAERYEYED